MSQNSNLNKGFDYMAKYLVETYYTCTYKEHHYLDDINES